MLGNNMLLVLMLLAGLSRSSTAQPDSVDALQGILTQLEDNLRQARSTLHAKRKLASLLDNTQAPSSGSDEPELAEETVVQLTGGRERAEQVAAEAGYQLLRQVRGLADTYVLRGLPANDVQPTALSKRSQQQTGDEFLATRALDEFDEVSYVRRQRIRRRVKRQAAGDTEADRLFNDPLWPQMWHLHDTRDMANLPKLDLHVLGAWRRGYNGTGVVVSVLDDGIQREHPDLVANYAAEASWDLNDEDADPTPRQNEDNKHGTRCAGEIGMEANNNVCGVGVAYGARVGGIRMLDGTITDRLEAEALSYNLQKVHVFSASWGPNDDGMTVEGPGKLASQALVEGIKKGRDGLGTIYVWASGNGGHYQDDCNCDGYTDSPLTLSVSSASQQGRFPWYGEKCASTLTSTYSSGAYTDQQIVTVDLEGCTTQHSGTSAAAPLAAGIVALALSANAALTWRDVQHIAVWTSEPAPLLHNDGWHKNSRGLWVNIRFGFGLMNADAFVAAAADWQPVPEQYTCITTLPNYQPTPISRDAPTVVSFTTDACGGQIKYLESLQLITDIEYTRRGNLALWLTSPSGTRTKLLSPRRRDDSGDGFRKWPFMSVHTWGEDPAGTWQLEVEDRHAHSSEDTHGQVSNMTLILYGTHEQPAHYTQTKQYNMEYNEKHDDRKKRLMERFAQLQSQVRSAGRNALQRVKRSTDNAAVESDINHLDQVLDGFETLDEHNKLHGSQSQTDNSVRSHTGQSRIHKSDDHHFDEQLFNLN